MTRPPLCECAACPRSWRAGARRSLLQRHSRCLCCHLQDGRETQKEHEMLHSLCLNSALKFHDARTLGSNAESVSAQKAKRLHRGVYGCENQSVAETVMKAFFFSLLFPDTDTS